MIKMNHTSIKSLYLYNKPLSIKNISMTYYPMKFVFNFLLLFILFTSFASGEEFFISGIREVSNELHLSDFQLGSQERIKDQTGFGSSLGWVSGSVSDLAYVDIELGSSETLYQGEIEDAVNVEFKTTTVEIEKPTRE